MKRTLANLLKRTARRMIVLANRLDGPKITLWDRNWNAIERSRAAQRDLRNAEARLQAMRQGKQ
jgi:hypothetical protein